MIILSNSIADYSVHDEKSVTILGKSEIYISTFLVDFGSPFCVDKSTIPHYQPVGKSTYSQSIK